MQYKVTVKRGKFKRSTIKVNILGEVFLNAPKFMSDDAIDSLLKEKEVWIINAIEKMLKLKAEKGEMKNELLYLGKVFNIEKVNSMSKYYEIDEENLVIRSGIDLNIKKYRLEFYKDRAKFILPARLATLAKIHGLTFTKVTIRDTKSRWGSCTSKQAISLSMRLIMTPIFVIDAIILHELTHTKLMNHSSHFYAMLYSLCPDYNISEKWLKDNYIKMII